MTEASAGPVFVVGGPRSGTTLLAAMLAAHPAFDCGPETHCLSRWARLGPRERARILDARDWPERATRYVCSLSLGKRPVHALFGLSRHDVRTWLMARPPALPALLESLTAQRAARKGRARWVEKTPRHLEVPELIVEAWPGARILRIVRDPRDAALSLTRVPFGTSSLLTNLSVLGRMNDAAADFYRHDPRARTLRYEDLVADPERELRRICAFVGEPFAASMLDGRATVTGVAAEHEWWKGDVTGPVDGTRSGRWRSEMPAEVQRYAALGLGDFLDEHGYPGSTTPARRLALVPAGDALSARYDEPLLRLSEADVAVARPVPRDVGELWRADPLVFFGVVGQLDPARGRPTGRRVLALGALAALLVLRHLRGRPVLWVRRLSLIRRHPRDAGERMTAILLRLLARRVEADDLPRLAGRPDRGVGTAPTTVPDGA